MLTDRYGLALTTSSAVARDAYVRGVDLLLSANVGAEVDFRCAIAEDPAFSAAHIGLARTLQSFARGTEAKAAAGDARATAVTASRREKSHVAILADIVEGNSANAFAAINHHIADWPRDVMALAPCAGVFGLIGFSGREGREAEQLAFLAPLADAYGDDWWFLTALAFAQVETGDIDGARVNIERALALKPGNANGAHIVSHLHYESGEAKTGLDYLTDFTRHYPREASLHCHLSWHVALWSLELGATEKAWAVYDSALHPGPSWGPPINTLTDASSFLFRAELAGEQRRPERWRELSTYALKSFPEPGIAFVDIHAALAHAMAGDAEALAHITEGAKGPVADLVAPLAAAFGLIAREQWADAARTISPLLSSHERFGGSRAQRDLIEYACVVALMRSGEAERAGRMLASRRPRIFKGGMEAV